jgi:4-hydroxybenzoate polyprenyltransferase
MLLKLRYYLLLIRFNKPIGTLLLLYPTVWALWFASHDKGQVIPDIGLLSLFIIGTCLMRSAGCAINDVADKEFDKHVLRTQDRVIATGLVSRQEGVYIAISLTLIAGVLALLFLSKAALMWCIPAVIVSGLYPLFKRFFAIPQVVLGIAFGFGIPIAYTATQYNLDYSLPVSAILLYVANFCWVLSYDTAYAMSDKPDDIKLGLKTSAIFFGKYDAVMVVIFNVLFLCLFAYVIHINNNNTYHYTYIYTYISWGLSVLYSAYLAVLLFRYHPDYSNNPQLYSDANQQQHHQLCFKVFISNHRIGLLLWIGLILDSTLY